ncbi:DUF3040 domain-containing protein [Saccharopolyspora rosea]|nr:DUF3040 domain-containing protein [Saccharopolyspora rosea]
MLRRHEKRLLDEMERRLRADDPEFADRMTRVRPVAWLLARMSPPRWIALVAGALAVLCLVLHEGAAFVAAAALAAALLVFGDWTVRTE